MNVVKYDENVIISCSYDATIKFWNILTGELLHSFKAHEGYIIDLKLLSRHTLVTAGYNDNKFKIWNFTDFKGSFREHLFSSQDTAEKI